jgi:hypothetical protein
MINATFKALEDQVQADQNTDGVIAFQMVGYKITVYGSVVENTFDTKIMKDGRQIVVNGDGFFPSGYRIN